MESSSDLLRLDQEELNAVYRIGEASPVPSGDSRGTAILLPGTCWTRPLSKAAGLLWQGKVFNADGSALINKILGLRLFTAKVYRAESWLDGKPSIIIDYSETSRAVGMVRDEIRRIHPGLYLGLAFFRTDPPALGVYFALDLGDA